MLEGRCPRLSMADRRYINKIFQDGLAFPMACDPAVRSQLLHAALSYRKIIPSLRTFLENAKYLKAMTDVIKKVLPMKIKGTIRQTMLRYYIGPKDFQFQVQLLENEFIQRKRSSDFGFWSAYRQIFLFAMRHFCGMTDSQPLGFSQISRSRCADRSELWQRLTTLLGKVGFIFPGSRKSHATNSIEFIAVRTLLTRLRPPELFAHEENNISEWSAKVASFLCSMTPQVVAGPSPTQSWDKPETWSLERRCGMTDTETYFLDQKYLFLEYIYSADHPAQENMTSFAVKRDIFQSFFPDMSDTNMELERNQVTAYNSNHDTPAVPQRDIEDTSMAEDHQVAIHHSNLPITPQATILPTEGMIQAQAIIQLPNSDLSNSHDAVQILQMSPTACKCTVNMSPDDFYASFIKLPRYNGVVFFEVATREALFLRPETADKLPDVINDLDLRWYAKVVNDTLSLKTFPLKDVFAMCQREPCFFFYGRTEGSGFKSQLSPDVTDKKISLPCFNPHTDLWSLQSS